MKKYFVSKNKQISGPYGLDEIKVKIEANELALSDYIYDEVTQEWNPILGMSEFAVNKPSASPKGKPAVKPEKVLTASVGDSNSLEWFILRGEKKAGPYIYKDLIRMLQEQELYEFDFVWNQTMKKWSRIAELRDFSPERIRDFISVDQSVFFKREYKRVDLDGGLILHDNFKVWKGENLLISEGGCCIRVANSMMQPGDDIFIHFKPTGDLQPFNAKGEVVGKKFDPNIRDIEHPIIYGVKFTDIKDEFVRKIRAYTKKSA